MENLLTLLTFALVSMLLWSPTLSNTLSEDVKSPEQTITMDTNDDFNVTWYTINQQDIVFKVEVRTTGWIGLGFSPAGGMKGADIILCGVHADGEVYLADRFAPENGWPILDENQDVELISASEKDGITIVTFKRPLINCDSQDVDLTKDTTRIIFAWGPTDSFSKHASSMRGQKSVYLLDKPKPDPESFGQDVKEFDLIYESGYRVSEGLDTVYTYGLVRAPELNNTRHHVISFDGIITPGNEGIVHHIVIMACYSDAINGSAILDKKQVFEKFHLMPPELYGCSHPIFTWAVGGGEFHYPEHAGLSIGGDDDPRWFVLNTHYDNPTKQEGKILDYSGIRIRYTPNLREHDVGVMNIGSSLVGFFVPPQQERFYIRGECTAECTQAGLPGSGMNVFGYLLHSHLIGHEISIIHRRGNQESVLADDKAYDFNYQETRHLPEEYNILPGDDMTVVCGMDSRTRQNITLGSEATYDEMCIAILYYYPRTPLAFCLSSLDLIKTSSTISEGGSVFTTDWTSAENVFAAQLEHLVTAPVHHCFASNLTRLLGEEGERAPPRPISTHSCVDSCKHPGRDCKPTLWTSDLEYRPTSAATSIFPFSLLLVVSIMFRPIIDRR